MVRVGVSWFEVLVRSPGPSGDVSVRGLNEGLKWTSFELSSGVVSRIGIIIDISE